MSKSQIDDDRGGTAITGDRLAFARLCEEHRDRLWRVVASVARGSDADDLVQEAIVRAYAARHTYRSDAPVEAWLCRIAVNAAHDYRRSAWRRRVINWSSWTGQSEPAGSVEDDAAHRDLCRQVREAVAGLPEPQRVPIWLHYMEGFTLTEIARLEGVQESTLRSRTRAGLKRLEGKLRGLVDILPVDAEQRGAEECRV